MSGSSTFRRDFHEEIVNRCGCCSVNLKFEKHFEIQTFQLKIFEIVFQNSIELSSDTICNFCNEQLINVHLFRENVKDKLKTFELEIKIEPEDDDYTAEVTAFAFIKTESPEVSMELEQDYEVAVYDENIQDISDITFVEPKKKRMRKPASEINNGKRKGGIIYNCCLCKKFTSDNKKDYADHILKNHALNLNKSIAKDSHERMILDSRPLPDPNCSVQCDYCGSIYSKRKNLCAHMKGHIEEAHQVDCPDCKKSFRDMRMMVRHRNYQHGHGKIFWCYCGNNFENSRDLNRCRYAHGRNRVPEKKGETCNECKAQNSFKSLRQLLNHKNKYHGNGTRFWCIRCGSLYGSKEEVTVCIKLHYNDVLKDIMVKCPECDKELLHNSLKIHLKSVHSQVREVLCQECGKAFCTVARLTVHMKQVHNNGIKPYLCDHCGRRWAQKKSLRDHIIKAHATNRRTYRCKICLKVCQNAIDRHMSLVHPNGLDNGVKVNPETNLFHCPNCIQTFRMMKAYEKHVNENLCNNYGDFEVDQGGEGKRLNVFTKGKFMCKICNSVQSTLARLRRHLNNVHSGEVSCPICSKNMKCKRSVIGHLRKVHKTNFTTVMANYHQRN